MIIGLGSDLVDIRRVEKIIQRYGKRFIDRIYTLEEREKSLRHHHYAASYARRFAAKEACAKALGTGFSGGVFWKDIGVLNMPGGKPFIELKGGARGRLQEMLVGGSKSVIHLTLSDDFPLAQAVVIIEAFLPDPRFFSQEGRGSMDRQDMEREPKESRS